MPTIVVYFVCVKANNIEEMNDKQITQVLINILLTSIGNRYSLRALRDSVQIFHNLL